MRAAPRFLAVCLLLLLGGCKTQLYASLSERDAMDMVAILLDHGIQASRTLAKDNTSTVEVDEGQVAAAVNLLRANRYPRADFESMGDVFQQKGMVSSPTAERARYMYGLTQELSRTLSDIDGVLTARVHVVLPQDDPLAGDGKPAAAAVFVRYDSHVAIVKLLPQIKMLVANSIEGLSYDKVSVVLLPVDVLQAVRPAHLATAAGGGVDLGWVLAILWPVGGGAVLLWRRYRPRAEPVVAVTPPKLRRVA